MNAYFPTMEETGCAALLPFWSAARLKNRYIDRSFIINRLEKWIERGWVDGAELYINYWEPIHDDLGLTVQYHGHVDPDTEIATDQFAYAYWKHPTLNYYHFTAINEKKECTYDPLGDSEIVKWDDIVSLRLFTYV